MKSPRERYPVFTYESFEIAKEKNDIIVSSNYRADPDLEFRSTNTFKNISSSVDLPSFEIFAFHIGLIEMLSYWKATCSPKIIIKAGKLTSEQIIWWSDLLIKGMGEYFYKNDIDFTQPDFVSIESRSDKTFSLYKSQPKSQYLIPVGGGKDSAVTIELFHRQTLPMVGFTVNPTPAANDVLKVGNVSDTIIVERKLDPKILDLNKRGFYNGHVPFSASIAFLSLLAAVLADCACVAVSNERSSNESTTTYLGYQINHQYSKSYEFEKKFREYVKANISTSIDYLSFLRPLSEIQISNFFSGMPGYFSIIRSCNRGQKTSSWCCNCPKCLSTYILLYPFLATSIQQIFPENLFEKETLFPILQSLIDPSKIRPFECVGTREESLIGLYLSIQHYGTNPLPVLLQKTYDQYLVHEHNLKQRSEILLSSWETYHFLPDQLEMMIHRA